MRYCDLKCETKGYIKAALVAIGCGAILVWWIVYLTN